MLQCLRMSDKDHGSLGWGVTTEQGAEIWDDNPVIQGENITYKDWSKLLFYPKKFTLYRYLRKTLWRKQGQTREHLRILDVGCGTGADVVDIKKIFGKHAEVIGLDVVALQVDLAKEKVKRHGIWAEFQLFDGVSIPFPDAHFDAVYTSDVLGHVQHVNEWLAEVARVLKPGGALAMFSESALGKHAYIRRYLFDRGLNVDPHAEFHISLYSKDELRHKISRAGFDIQKMYSLFWASFLVHPDEFYKKLQAQKKFPLLRFINKLLYLIKQKTRPFSLAVAELYGLVEMHMIGRWVQSQGYIILAKKKKH